MRKRKGRGRGGEEKEKEKKKKEEGEKKKKKMMMMMMKVRPDQTRIRSPRPSFPFHPGPQKRTMSNLFSPDPSRDALTSHDRCSWGKVCVRNWNMFTEDKEKRERRRST